MLLALAVICISVILYAIFKLSLPKKISCNFWNKHVFITGIGKAIAIEVLRQGCRQVTIAARGVESLNEATEELKLLCKHGQEVKWYALDLSKEYEENCEQESGHIDILINNAGTSCQGEFDELDITLFEKQMKSNYLSAVYTSRSVISGMKSRSEGHIALVSSAAGQCAIWGYSAYSPPKFALRGFAETLHMELLPYNIGISILFPPNTNTEGFQEELKDMPDEISDSAGIFSAKEVAQALVENMASGNFAVTIGLEGWILGVLTAGGAPEPNLWKAFTQVC